MATLFGKRINYAGFGIGFLFGLLSGFIIALASNISAPKKYPLHAYQLEVMEENITESLG